MEKDQEYVSLLRIFACAIEANGGLPAGDDDFILDAEGLAVKCFFHASSCLYLSRSTTLPDLAASFFDTASINVLARATLESYLVFNYIFIEPQTEEEKRFRYSAWLLSDLMEKQKFPTRSPQGKKILEDDDVTIKDMKSTITKNSFFLRLTEKQQKALLDRGAWRVKSWTEIGMSAGLSEIHAKSFYKHLCSYAHAGSLSVHQIRLSDTAPVQQKLYAATMTLVMITIAYFIRDYSKIFTRCQEYVSGHEEAIRMWLDIGASDLTEVEIDWNDVTF